MLNRVQQDLFVSQFQSKIQPNMQHPAHGERIYSYILTFSAHEEHFYLFVIYIFYMILLKKKLYILIFLHIDMYLILTGFPEVKNPF